MSFEQELTALCLKHGIALLGNHKLVKLEKYKPDTLSYRVTDIAEFGGLIDRSGQFLVGMCEYIPAPVTVFKRGVAPQYMNREKVMGGGIQSMVDGKIYDSRDKYEAHLKANGKEIVGNDSSLYRDQHGNDVRDSAENY